MHNVMKVKVFLAQSCPTLFDPMDCSLPGSLVHGILQTRILEGCRALLQGIFPTQESNSGFLHCRLIPYHLRHQGSHDGMKWGIKRGQVAVLQAALGFLDQPLTKPLHSMFLVAWLSTFNETAHTQLCVSPNSTRDGPQGWI